MGKYFQAINTYFITKSKKEKRISYKSWVLSIMKSEYAHKFIPMSAPSVQPQVTFQENKQGNPLGCLELYSVFKNAYIVIFKQIYALLTLLVDCIFNTVIGLASYLKQFINSDLFKLMLLLIKSKQQSISMHL